jgi:uncharacterized protein YjbI with pentapeptide repeats
MPANFSRQNLRGKTFRDQDLTGADFSYADIRGADFSNAILTKANLSFVKAGQKLYWIIGFIVISFILSFLTGIILGYAGVLFGSIMVWEGAAPVGLWSGIVALISLSIFSYIAVKKGLGSALGTFSIIIIIIVALVVIFSGNEDRETDRAVAVILHALGIATVIASVILSAIAITVGRRLFRFGLYISLAGALIGCVPGAIAGLEGLKISSDHQLLALAIVGIVAVLSITLSAYISWRVIIGDKNYFLIPQAATWLASFGGTCFQGANLTDADFTQAELKRVDFRKATLKRSNWFKSSYLEQCRLEGTYLENSQVRQLVTTKNGSEQNYDYLNLRGLNLENVNFKNASLIGTDFNESNLKKACLAKAELVKAQLYQTDLTGACLTGAYIQDWGISTETNLNNIKCEYIYMRLPTKDDPDPSRKPDNKQENFQDGDFADFIAPIIKTLDLYQTQNVDTRKIASKFKTLDLFHHEGIDPSAAAVTIKEVAKNNPGADLEVIALEGRGNEKIRLQAKVSNTADRSKLSEEYFTLYERVKTLSYDDIQKLLIGFEEKDSRIRSLEKLLKDALQQPKFYVETYQNQGEFIMDNKEVNVSGGQGNIINVADYMSNVTNTVNQNISQSDVPDEIKDLVKKLTEQIAAIGTQIDPKTAEQMGSDLEVLSKEMTKPEPRKRWYDVSLEGLKEAAVAVGELGKPILETLAKLSPLILSAIPK